ncbi:MAG: hypothetical protein R3E10_18720 [Gemmatimonadota bacterium]
MTRAASLRTAAGFSILALGLMMLGVVVMVASSGTGAQDPLERFSDPATFTAILLAADPALRLALFFDGLFAIAYAGTVGFAAIGLAARCPPAAWASGLGILVTMGLDVTENLLMLGSLGMAAAGVQITGERIALHVLISGLKLHAAAFALVAFAFTLPDRGLVTSLMRWGVLLMPVSAILFVTDVFGASGYGSLGVFVSMVGGMVLLAFFARAEAGREPQSDPL